MENFEIVFSENHLQYRKELLENGGNQNHRLNINHLRNTEFNYEINIRKLVLLAAYNVTFRKIQDIIENGELKLDKLFKN